MQQQIITIESEYRENIRSVAEKILKLAKKGVIVNTVFNGVPLTTENMSSVEDILKQRDDNEQRKYEEYINSPQYKIDREAAKKRELEEEAKTAGLLQEFKDLDFDSVSEVVNWIGRMAICRNDVVAMMTEVLPKLKDSGYQSLSEISLNDEYMDMPLEGYIMVAEDLDEVGNYLVGLTIDSIKSYGSIDDVINHFSQVYERRLNEPNNANDVSLIKTRGTWRDRFGNY